MRYDAVLFDMDGTVLDTLEDMRDSVNASLRHFSLPELTLEQVRTYVGNGARRLIEQAVPEGSGSALTERVLAYYKPYYDAHCRIKTKAYEGILPLMTELREHGLRLGIISNKPDTAVRELAEDFFPGLLEIAVGENESAGVRRKPWPDSVNTAVRLLGLSKSRCVYVGDSEVDIATAKNAGLDCISVCWGFRSREELKRACASVIVGNTEELKAELLKE